MTGPGVSLILNILNIYILICSSSIPSSGLFLSLPVPSESHFFNIVSVVLVFEVCVTEVPLIKHQCGTSGEMISRLAKISSSVKNLMPISAMTFLPLGGKKLS